MKGFSIIWKKKKNRALSSLNSSFLEVDFEGFFVF